MIRGITILSVALLAALIASPAAFAGSTANVVQAGDNHYSIVVQSRNKTMVKSGVAANPGAQYHVNQKVTALARQASRQVAPTTGKMGGARCHYGFGGANAAHIAQAGTGNSAVTNQFGVANTASTLQTGINNKSYIVQRGVGNQASVTQDGNSNTSLIIQRC